MQLTSKKKSEKHIKRNERKKEQVKTHVKLFWERNRGNRFKKWSQRRLGVWKEEGEATQNNNNNNNKKRKMSEK